MTIFIKYVIKLGYVLHYIEEEVTQVKKVIALILSLLLIVAFALTAVGCKKAEVPKPDEAPVAVPAAPAEAPVAPAAPAGK
ncbi:MAG: hypothetical protein Q7J70_04305 [Thermodesulfovibrionales bacterium]|nr:hypothetical protein [Thermodesulfovibrionales bacterium]